MSFLVRTKKYTAEIPINGQITIPLSSITAGNINITVMVFSIPPPGQSPRPPGPPSNLTFDLKCNEHLLGSSSNGHLLVHTNIVSNKYKIVMKNTDQNRVQKNLQVTVVYPSSMELQQKQVPLQFFANAFDSFWNTMGPPPFRFWINSNKLNIEFEKQLAESFGLQNKVFDLEKNGKLEVGPLGNDLTIRDFNSSKISFKATYGKNPDGGKYLRVPVFQIRVEFEDKGVEFDVNNVGNVNLIGPIVMKIDLFWKVQFNKIVFVPRVKFEIEAVNINNAPNSLVTNVPKIMATKIQEALNDFKIGSYAKYLQPWILGGEYNAVLVGMEGLQYIIEYEPLEEEDEPGDWDRLPPFHMPDGPVSINNPGRLAEIDHFVFLMMENRSFDQVLGYLSLPGRNRSDVNGLNPLMYEQWANIYNGKKYMPKKIRDVHLKESACHDYECVKKQLANNNHGFVANFAERFEAGGSDVSLVMDYYDGDQLEVYSQLANEFAICDNWYCAHPGPTWPNRFITLTGHLNLDEFGQPQLDNPSLRSFRPLKTKTIFDYLTDHDVSWKYYEHGYCFLRLFHKYTFDTKNVISAKDPDKGFFATARKGQLPSVTFLDPDFIEYPPGNDDHAPANPLDGQKLIQDVVNALKANPAAWAKTMLVITYDEHGGYFDHAKPPYPAPMISGISDQYGVRVPTFIVSPKVKKGGVSHEIFDHTSILATIVKRFFRKPIKELGNRVNKANSLESLIIESNPRIIPDIRFSGLDTHSRRKHKGKSPVASDNDWHELMLLGSAIARASL